MRRPCFYPSLILGFLLFSSAQLAESGHRGAGSPFQILSKSATEWTVAYSYRPVPTATTEVNGTPHIVFTSPLHPESSKPGVPGLPVEIFTLGVPFSANVTVTLVDPVYEEEAKQDVAPTPTYKIKDDKDAVATYVKDAAAYGRNAFFPSTPVNVLQPISIRQQRIATIRIAPYQYNPVTRILRRLQKATLKVTLNQTPAAIATGPARVPASRDTYFEDVYKHLLDNYEQARQWRGEEATLARVTTDSTRTWFETGKKYYRIKISNDGWYKVATSDLISAGTDPSIVDWSTLHIFGRGAEVPFVVRPDSSIQFRALRNRGDSTYINFYTDTNTYWLTWMGLGGIRYTPVSQPDAPPGPTVQSVDVTRHFEQNTSYFFGTTESEISDIATIPGEGWVWEYYYPGTTYTHNFATDAVDTLSRPFATLRVRLFSTTLHYNTPDHIARFWVNNHLAGEISFNGRKEGLFSVSIPSSWLVGGSNVLKITSVATASSPNQFSLDWFEVDYRRSLKAVDGQLTFTVSPQGGTAPALVKVGGFNNPQISVFDPDTHREIQGGAITGDATNGYSIAFKDTLSAPRTYVAVGQGGAKSTGPITGKIFSDIRSNPTGADYIIIAHRKFIGYAQSLARNRQAVNGVRTALIDVQDIYDEFNYGILDVAPIKAFLRFAYQQWTRPAPAYVVMFGGASEDSHKYIAASTKTEYIPAYGHPASDNWFVCFDSSVAFVPSLFIGRIPVQDSTEADQVVQKIMAFDSWTLGEWDKSFLFIAGGNSPGEQSMFTALSEGLKNGFVLPRPIGGIPYMVNKTASGVIDGDSKQSMQDLIKNGLVFVNFLGHSGGRIWNVDIGSPNDLQNTNGRLPFVSSVSCNVANFASAYENTLSEDFLFADNRGAIAVWGSSSIGYANVGTTLVANFLSAAIQDTLRDLGSLTTAARLRLWQLAGNDYIVVGQMNCTPLVGDPLSRIAIPLKPDLAVAGSDISLNRAAPTLTDTALAVRVDVHNFGLVPNDSIGITLSDSYNGHQSFVIDNKRIAPTVVHDSIIVPWPAASQVGRHSLTLTVDPSGLIDEVSKTNNAASVDQYVYAHSVAIIRPLNNAVVPPGPQTLLVSTPLGLDSTIYHYAFELDTVETFDSPYKLTSGSIAPAPVSGQWTTPSLSTSRLYYWRVRAEQGSLVGNWVMSAFSVTADPLPSSGVRWRQYAKSQFAREEGFQVAATDSGVSIQPSQGIRLYARSLGNRGNVNNDYFSYLKVNDQTILGYWWVLGNSFMVLRVDDFTGSYDFKAFNVQGQPDQADSMKQFIRNTPPGNYVSIAVLFDGYTNVSESLYVAIESLGSTMIRQIRAGHAWSLIGRKGSTGPAMPPVEDWSPTGITLDSLAVPNYYGLGSGSITLSDLPTISRWNSLRWRNAVLPGKTDARLAIIGRRAVGSPDTLRVFPHDSTLVDLGFLNGRDTAYSSVVVSVFLWSNDPLTTPLLQDLSMDFEPPGDLAISGATVGVPGLTIQRGTTLNLPVTVYNLGYRTTGRAWIDVSVEDLSHALHPVSRTEVDSIAAGGQKSLTIPVPTSNLSHRVQLNVGLTPERGGKDLVAGNNTAGYSFQVTGDIPANILVFSDGIQLMDGDYVSSRPKITLRLPPSDPAGVQRNVELYVDNVQVGNTTGNPEFDVTLVDGRHEMRAVVVQQDLAGAPDSLSSRIAVNVLNDYRILQVFNYPNPFASETYFTCVLTGARPPEELIIRVFSVAGRKIREIRVPPSEIQIGFNRVFWDGRDNDGDEIANGYYFYQVQVTGGGKTMTAIQKLVKVR